MDTATAVARKQVEATETAIKQEQEDMRNAEKAGLTLRKHDKPFEEMLNAMGDSLSDLASSDDVEDGDDEEDDEEYTELGKLSEDDKPGWVMGRISKMVKHCMESFRQKQMRLDELTQQGWGDTANWFREREVKYGMAEFKVPAVVKLHSD